MIDWAVATRRLAGEVESGDAYAVVSFDGGTLLAVVDGLGHGTEAAVASARAIALLTQMAGADLVSLMEASHAALHDTRGAVISLASVSDGERELTWLGVGDAAATLVRSGFSKHPRETLLLRPGIIGHSLPRLITETMPLYPNDALVMCTDGIRSRYVEALDEIEAPQQTANRLLEHYGRQYDDALVLVACYLGGEG